MTLFRPHNALPAGGACPPGMELACSLKGHVAAVRAGTSAHRRPSLHVRAAMAERLRVVRSDLHSCGADAPDPCWRGPDAARPAFVAARAFADGFSDDSKMREKRYDHELASGHRRRAGHC